MGILTTGIKYGGIFLAAREGVKAYDRHTEKKRTAQQPQQQGMPNQYPAQQQPPYQQSRDMSSPYQDQPYPQQQIEYSAQSQEVGGSFHQVWCNGRCGGKCGGKEALMAMSGAQQQQYGDAKPPPAY